MYFPVFCFGQMCSCYHYFLRKMILEEKLTWSKRWWIWFLLCRVWGTNGSFKKKYFHEAPQVVLIWEVREKDADSRLIKIVHGNESRGFWWVHRWAPDIYRAKWQRRNHKGDHLRFAQANMTVISSKAVHINYYPRA